MERVEVAPIHQADFIRVGAFLHENLNRRIDATSWARAMVPPWSVECPNHGFMLLHGRRIVGVYLAFYSDRHINGRNERFCNLAAWCVLPKFRLHGLRLLRALLGQPNYHFTDLSPSGNTVPINERLKFQRLDTATALMVNLPWPSRPGRYRLTADPATLMRILSGVARNVYHDHRNARAAHHLAICAGNDVCYVIFRRETRRGLRLFASVIYVSNPALFLRVAELFGRHLLLRYGIPFTLLESRVVGGWPRKSVRLRSSRTKMFKSETLSAEQIDYLYSELVCVAW